MIICAGKEESGTQAKVRQPVTMRVGDALDDAMQSQSSEVIRHCTGLYLIRSHSEQRCEMLAQAAVGEPHRQGIEQQHGMAERVHVPIAESES